MEERDIDRAARVRAAQEAVLLLEQASGLDAEALLHCLAITTANLLSADLLQEDSLPDEIEAALRAYMAGLARHVWTMIHNHDTGRTT